MPLLRRCTGGVIIGQGAVGMSTNEDYFDSSIQKPQRHLVTLERLVVKGPPGEALLTIHPCCTSSCGSDFEPFYDFPRENNSTKSLELAKSWLSTCKRNHPQCSFDSHSYIPSRLLDVSTAKPRLVLRAEIFDNTPFVALSHCWGKSLHLTTTSQNLDLHREGIALDEFPPTLRDAIIITRKIGLDYIWIDSICIIQDSVADWGEESGHMDKIYGQADLVLAASAARNSEVGILNKRTTIPHGFVSLPNKDQAIPPTFQFRLLVRHRGQDELDSRAWAFQERLMARRYLSFTGQDLVWECCEYSTCECGWNLTKSQPFEHLRNLKVMMETTSREHWVEDLWRRQIINVYTQMSLSIPSDKLVGLSAVASQIQATFGGTYLAGL
ncbi:heterokaryon incompatibility protein-domain-containing protein [Xylariaceae sp. FL1651]|nr:heterokaryon incompatibility protein-domain-containing protein [Xylariaceae sp. FL1651]